MCTRIVPLAFLLLTSFASAIEITKSLKVEPSQDKTAEDIPATFELQRADWSGETMSVIGKLKNDSEKDYRYANLILEVFTAEGKFITRVQTDSYPNKLGKGKVCYVDSTYINTGDEVPARITVKVTGDEESDDF